MANKFKTGSTINVSMELDISGEVLATLPQILFVYYYITKSGKKITFAHFAKNPAEAGIAARAAAADPPITLLPIVINGTTVTMTIPPANTDSLEIEDCERLAVHVEIDWEDDNSDKDKGIEEEDTNEDVDCDPFVGTLIGSVSEGLL